MAFSVFYAYFVGHFSIPIHLLQYVIHAQKLALKNFKRQCHAILCTVSNTTTGPDSKLKLTAIGIFNPLYTY